MDVSEFIEVLLTNQQRTWQDDRAPGVLRAIASGVRDKDNHPIEHWCLVTTACHAHTHRVFHPGDYKDAAKVLHLDSDTALAISMFGDGLLSHSHPLYSVLNEVAFQLLHRGGDMKE